MADGESFKAQLRPAEAAALMRQVNGQGGFQTLLRALQKAFDPNSGAITITDDQIEKINRYTSEYGAGGFEDRLDGIRRELPNILK